MRLRGERNRNAGLNPTRRRSFRGGAWKRDLVAFSSYHGSPSVAMGAARAVRF